jgi:hypothetical protein
MVVKGLGFKLSSSAFRVVKGCEGLRILGLLRV